MAGPADEEQELLPVVQRRPLVRRVKRVYSALDLLRIFVLILTFYIIGSRNKLL